MDAALSIVVSAQTPVVMTHAAVGAWLTWLHGAKLTSRMVAGWRGMEMSAQLCVF